MTEKLYQLTNKEGKTINNTIVKECGTTSILYSYNTPVCEIHHGSAFIRFYKDWNFSATTLKHIKAFLYNELRIEGMTKKNIQFAINTGVIYADAYKQNFYCQHIKEYNNRRELWQGSKLKNVSYINK